MQHKMTHVPRGGNVQNQASSLTRGCMRRISRRHLKHEVSRSCSLRTVQRVLWSPRPSSAADGLMVGVRPTSLRATPSLQTRLYRRALLSSPDGHDSGLEHPLWLPCRVVAGGGLSLKNIFIDMLGPPRVPATPRRARVWISRLLTGSVASRSPLTQVNNNA